MQNKQRYLTFLTPTMKRTGSEIVLYNLIERLSKNYVVKIISVFKGELLSILSKNYSVYYVHNKVPNNIISKIGFRIKEYLFIRVLNLNRYSTWYMNTIVLWNFLEYAEKNKVKVILHVHELEQIFSLLSKEQLQRAVNYPDLVIANSNYTMQLVRQYGRTKPIELCYPAIDTKKIISNPDIKKTYRSKLNISDNSYVWVMCGTLDENKNPELFIDIACELVKLKPNAVFLWIGSAIGSELLHICESIAFEKNIAHKIIWIDSEGKEFLNYFNCADGFVLTSKKESFSIVTLEALLLGLPVVTHDCGGVREILREDIGTIVKEKNNVSQFSEAMSLYMNDHTLHNKVKGIERAQEFDIEIWSKKWNKFLDIYID